VVDFDRFYRTDVNNTGSLDFMAQRIKAIDIAFPYTGASAESTKAELIKRVLNK
jgi:hypothetical protein